MNKSQRLIPLQTDLIHEIESNKKLLILPTTLHDVYWAKRVIAYKDVDIFIPDGMPLVFYLKMKNIPSERLYGPDIFSKFIEKYNTSKHVFIASKITLDIIKKKNTKLNALYLPVHYSEDIHSLISPDMLRNISKFSPQFIWIGLSTPKQIEMGSIIIRKIPNNCDSKVICVGAAFDFYTGRQVPTPALFQKFGLEWLYRFIHNPCRLWKRYLVYSVLAIFSLGTFFSGKLLEDFKKV